MEDKMGIILVYVISIILGYFSRNIHNLVTSHPAFTSSKLTIKTLERRQWRVFIVNFEHIPHLALVFLLLSLSR